MFIREEGSNLALVDEKNNLNFFHSKSTAICPGLSSYAVYCQLCANPPYWLRLSFKIRDKISAIAGIKNIGGFKPQPRNSPQAGEKLDFFDVLAIDRDELLLSADDKHLCVLVAIQITRQPDTADKLTITTSVKNKNILGTLYMIPVKPAHEVIINYMIKKLQPIR